MSAHLNQAQMEIFYKERKQEYDTMEFERLQRDCWVEICKQKNGDKTVEIYLDQIEQNLKDQLTDKHQALNIRFNRIKKKITFEIECEEIEL